jgi:hypothetical protein
MPGVSATLAQSACSGWSYFAEPGLVPGRAGATGFTPAAFIASSMLTCSFRASLMASRTCSWKRTCSAMSPSATPSPAMRGSDFTSSVRVVVWPPDVSLIVYLPGGTMGPPGPPSGALGAHGPGKRRSHRMRCMPASGLIPGELEAPRRKNPRISWPPTPAPLGASTVHPRSTWPRASVTSSFVSAEGAFWK